MYQCELVQRTIEKIQVILLDDLHTNVSMWHDKRGIDVEGGLKEINVLYLLADFMYPCIWVKSFMKKKNRWNQFDWQLEVLFSDGYSFCI